MSDQLWTLRRGMEAGRQFTAALHDCEVAEVVTRTAEFDVCRVNVIGPIEKSPDAALTFGRWS